MSKVIPMFLTTSDSEKEEYCEKRYMYFVLCINSLKRTNADLSKLIIFDDRSIFLKKLQFLLSCSWEFFVKYRHENLGPTLNTIYSMDYMFETYNSEYLVFLQDDVVFSKDWLIEGLKVFAEIDNDIANKSGDWAGIEANETVEKVGILALYNRTGPDDRKYYLFPTGHPGGVAWIVKKAFWDDYRKNYELNDPMDTLIPRNERVERKRQTIRNLVDYKICHRAHGLGWDCAKVGQSLVQHIGDQSSLGDRDMTQHRSKNFVGEK